MPNDPIIEVVAGLVEKLALELAFVAPGSDSGLLPLNNFVMDMEDRVIGRPAPEEIKAAVTQARSWLDRLFETTVQFDQDTIARFGEWHGWMASALEKWQQGQPLPAIRGVSRKVFPSITPKSPSARLMFVGKFTNLSDFIGMVEAQRSLCLAHLVALAKAWRLPITLGCVRGSILL